LGIVKRTYDIELQLVRGGGVRILLLATKGDCEP